MPRSRARSAGLGYGKALPEAMDALVYRNLGEERGEVLVGPGRGLDNAVLSLTGQEVLILTVDPVSMIPSIGARKSAWLSVHLIASDFTTSGVDPEFATFSYNFPPEMSGRQVGEYLRSVGDECRRLGMAVVAGNTGTYPGGAFTVIGAGTMFGRSRQGAYVTPAMARAGDAVIVTKGAAIEATASLACSFPRSVADAIGRRRAAEARMMIELCSTVADARTARKVGVGSGGVTAMHDSTEGGVLGALDEMASASGKAFVVDPSEIPVADAAAEVCALFGLDPLMTMGEGALVVTCDPGSAAELEQALSREGIPAKAVGTVREGKGLMLSEPGKRRHRYTPRPDGYWRAYSRGVRRASRA